MENINNTLEVKKVKRSYCIMAGKSILGRFKTKELASASLIEDAELYSYWAGSASVSSENTPPTTTRL